MSLELFMMIRAIFICVHYVGSMRTKCDLSITLADRPFIQRMNAIGRRGSASLSGGFFRLRDHCMRYELPTLSCLYDKQYIRP